MNTFKVGLLVIISIASVVIMSVKITSNQSGFGDYVEYRSIFKDASGIFPKTPIKVAGIPVGRIIDIQLQRRNALVTFEILEDVPITEGSIIRVRTVGFLGDKFLDVKLSKSKKVLKKHSLVPIEEVGGIETVLSDVRDIIYDTRKIISEIKDTILPEDKKPPIRAILENISGITIGLREFMQENQDKLENTIDNAEEFMARLSDNLDQNQKDSIVSDVKRSLANVEELTDNIKGIVGDVRDGRGTLGRIISQEDIADDLKETLSGVNKIVNKANTLKTEVSVFTGYTSGDKDGGETNANLTIYPSPERYYILGIATSDFGNEKETHIKTTTGGTVKDEVKVEKLKSQYKFNASIGRRFHNWSIYGGLIESSGGVGFGYDFARGRFKVGMDIFELGNDDGANIRLSNKFRLWNVFYGRLSMDQIGRSRIDTTVSAGIVFDDEDLKGLLGFFL